MPSFIKTPADEKLWDRAKQLAEEQGHKEDWPYVTGIYKRMHGGKVAFSQEDFKEDLKNLASFIASKTGLKDWEIENDRINFRVSDKNFTMVVESSKIKKLSYLVDGIYLRMVFSQGFKHPFFNILVRTLFEKKFYQTPTPREAKQEKTSFEGITDSEYAKLHDSALKAGNAAMKAVTEWLQTDKGNEEKFALLKKKFASFLTKWGTGDKIGNVSNVVVMSRNYQAGLANPVEIGVVLNKAEIRKAFEDDKPWPTIRLFQLVWKNKDTGEIKKSTLAETPNMLYRLSKRTNVFDEPVKAIKEFNVDIVGAWLENLGYTDGKEQGLNAFKKTFGSSFTSSKSSAVLSTWSDIPGLVGQKLVKVSPPPLDPDCGTTLTFEDGTEVFVHTDACHGMTEEERIMWDSAQDDWYGMKEELGAKKACWINDPWDMSKLVGAKVVSLDNAVPEGVVIRFDNGVEVRAHFDGVRKTARGKSRYQFEKGVAEGKKLPSTEEEFKHRQNVARRVLKLVKSDEAILVKFIADPGQDPKIVKHILSEIDNIAFALGVIQGMASVWRSASMARKGSDLIWDRFDEGVESAQVVSRSEFEYQRKVAKMFLKLFREKLATLSSHIADPEEEPMIALQFLDAASDLAYFLGDLHGMTRKVKMAKSIRKVAQEWEALRTHPLTVREIAIKWMERNLWRMT